MIGWRTGDQGAPEERLLIMLNFEGFDVPVDVSFNFAGRWVKLADIESVNENWLTSRTSAAGPGGENGHSILKTDGEFKQFVLPPYSGFIYKYAP